MNHIGRKPILIVDDTSSNRKLLRMTLEAEGLRVLEAADGLEALQQLEREPVAGIISDILMPHMDGYRLCHEVRKKKQWRTIPFIFYTSTYTSPADEMLARDLGSDRFLRKPASTPVILAAIRESLRQELPADMGCSEMPSELDLMKEYSARLVSKLEEKNIELESRTMELQASEARYRALTEAAHDIIFATDRTGVLQYVNAHGAQELGRPAEELVGKRQEDLFAPEVAKAHLEWVQQVFSTGEPLHIENSRVVNGHEHYESTCLSPIRDAAGQVTSVLGIARDITDHKQAERLRSSIVLSLSHELNTPLNGIVGFLDMMRSNRESLSREELLDGIDDTYGSAQQLQRLVQRNLDYAELEMLTTDPTQAGHLRQRPPDGLRAFAQAIAHRLAREHGRSDDLRLEMIDGIGPCNARFLSRLLSEILDNAFKFTPAKTPILFVVREQADTVFFEVQDAGRGMSEQQIAQIGAFVQFDRQHFEQQGIGLGLHMAKRIAELLGGSLQITSRPKSGTRVAVMLPKHSPRLSPMP